VETLGRGRLSRRTWLANPLWPLSKKLCLVHLSHKKSRLRLVPSWLHHAVRPSACPTPPCRHRHPPRHLYLAPPPPSLAAPPYPAAPPSPAERRNPISRYAASRPADCRCCWTRSPSPHPSPPSSMRVLDDCSSTSVPAAPCRAPSSETPRPGAGTTGRCQATPPSSAVGGRNPLFPTLLCAARRRVKNACCKHIFQVF
jgi:hypothetical protein